jgi:hypothetical protein
MSPAPTFAKDRAQAVETEHGQPTEFSVCDPLHKHPPSYRQPPANWVLMFLLGGEDESLSRSGLETGSNKRTISPENKNDVGIFRGAVGMSQNTAYYLQSIALMDEWVSNPYQ